MSACTGCGTAIPRNAALLQRTGAVYCTTDCAAVAIATARRSAPSNAARGSTPLVATRPAAGERDGQHAPRKQAPQRVGATTLLGTTATETRDIVAALDYITPYGEEPRKAVADAMRTVSAFVINLEPHQIGQVAWLFSALLMQMATAVSQLPMDASEMGRLYGVMIAYWVKRIASQYLQDAWQTVFDAMAAPSPLDPTRYAATPIEVITGILDVADLPGDTARMLVGSVLTSASALAVERPGILRELIRLITSRPMTPGRAAVLKALLSRPWLFLGREVSVSEVYGQHPDDVKWLRGVALRQVHDYALAMRAATTRNDLVTVLKRITRLLVIYNSWATTTRDGALFLDAASCVRMLRDVAMAFVDPGSPVHVIIGATDSVMNTELRLCFAAMLHTYAGPLEEYLATDVRAVGNIDFADYVELYALVTVLMSRAFGRAYEAEHKTPFDRLAIIRMCINTCPTMLGAPAPAPLPLDYAANVQAELSASVCLLIELLNGAYGSPTALCSTGLLSKLRLSDVRAVVDPIGGEGPRRRARPEVVYTEEEVVYTDEEVMDTDRAMARDRAATRKVSAGRPDEATISWAAMDAAFAAASAGSWSPAVATSSSSSSSAAAPGAAKKRSQMETDATPDDDATQQQSRPRVTVLPSYLSSAPASAASAAAAAAATTTTASTPSTAATPVVPMSANARIGLSITAAQRAAMADVVAPLSAIVGQLRMLRVLAAICGYGEQVRSALSYDERIALVRTVIEPLYQLSFSDADAVMAIRCIRAASMPGEIIDSSSVGDTIAVTGVGAAVANHPPFAVTFLVDAMGRALISKASVEATITMIADVMVSRVQVTPAGSSARARVAISGLYRLVPALAGLIDGSGLRAEDRKRFAVGLGNVAAMVAARVPLSTADKTAIVIEQLYQIIERVPYQTPISGESLELYLPPGILTLEAVDATVTGLGLTIGTAENTALNDIWSTLTKPPFSTEKTMKALKAARAMIVSASMPPLE